MDFAASISAFTDWVSANSFRLIITAVVCIAYFLLDRISAPRIKDNVDQSGFKDSMATKAVRTSRIIFGIVGVLVLAIVWGVQFSSVFIFASTTLTLLGVALFANWSILSNITAYFVLLLQPQYSRGTFIRVIELDNYVEGYISEITIFNTRLTTVNRETIVYPNNLLLARATIVDPASRLAGVGKLPADDRRGIAGSLPRRRGQRGSAD
jgi:small-conductance mechanosensitive channel